MTADFLTSRSFLIDWLLDYCYIWERELFFQPIFCTVLNIDAYETQLTEVNNIGERGLNIFVSVKYYCISKQLRDIPMFLDVIDFLIVLV